ncbi:hypothetical protein FBX98_104253 [Burkholderia sp. SJZ115]|nr:hypothetical protein FB600_104253 [Burkholderia sp. SJZ089]TWD05106.1 hypothetical protein FBX98_104253 [Burkholderia sp. SJZ115]TWD05368.1 hypothetical protein FB601_108112 [Burkholderia sp. SJZ091]
MRPFSCPPENKTADADCSAPAVGPSIAAGSDQNTGCPLITLGSQVEKNGQYVTILIALKIAR